MDEFSTLLDILADRIAAKVVDRLRAGETPGYIDQVASPLGRRRHIAAVRRRLGSGKGGAVQIGRRYLLSREALAEEVGAPSTPKKRSRRQELLEELGLEDV